MMNIELLTKKIEDCIIENNINTKKLDPAQIIHNLKAAKEEKEKEIEKLTKRFEELTKGIYYIKRNDQLIYVNTKLMFGKELDINDPGNENLINTAIDILELTAERGN